MSETYWKQHKTKKEKIVIGIIIIFFVVSTLSIKNHEGFGENVRSYYYYYHY